MKKTLIFAIVIALAVFSVTGCGNKTGTSSGIENPASGMQVATLSGKPKPESALPTIVPTAVDHGPFILMLDDFSDPSSGWEVSENDYGRAAYEQGGYLIEGYVEKEYYWGVAGKDYADIRIDVDATVLHTAESGNDTYGVDCRVQENGDGYGFRISSDGWVSISKYVDTQGSKLVDWLESDAIFTDGQPNHLTAICQGNHLQFLVNEVNVAEAVDDTFSQGDIALSAAPLEASTISVLFDDIVVQELGNPYDYED